MAMTEYLLACLVGLAVGSFLNFVITGLSQEEPFWTDRRRCPHCQQDLPWQDLIPLLSYA